MLTEDIVIQIQEELDYLDEYIDTWKNDYTSDYMFQYINAYRNLSEEEIKKYE